MALLGIVGANIKPAEALIIGDSEGATAGLLIAGVGPDAAEAVRACGNFRKVKMITARMSKAPRAHVRGLYFLRGAVFVDFKGLDINTPPGLPVDDLLRRREPLSSNPCNCKDNTTHKDLARSSELHHGQFE
jgi:hypothetical protein